MKDPGKPISLEELISYVTRLIVEPIRPGLRVDKIHVGEALYSTFVELPELIDLVDGGIYWHSVPVVFAAKLGDDQCHVDHMGGATCKFEVWE